MARVGTGTIGSEMQFDPFETGSVGAVQTHSPAARI